MKKHLLLWLAAMPLFLAAQQTYTWNVSSGSWTDPANWLPQRTTPAPNDILEFNFSATVSAIPVSESIGKISVYNNAVIHFNAPALSTITIGDASVAAPHFYVDAGSSLFLSGSNSITLNIAVGFSGQVDGNMDFSGGPHRLTATDTGPILFTNGATCTANNGFTGNAFGNAPINKNSVIFQSGATYILKDGGNPFALAAPTAVTIFNNGSIYRHQVNGIGPSLPGRTYGYLYIESNVNFAGIGSANDCTIQNDLNVLSGFFSYKPANGSHTGNFKIFGNISAAGSSLIDIGSPNMPGAVQLLGTNQTVGSGGGSGTITFQHFTVNNISTLLSRDITVTGVLNLTGGKILSSASALPILSSTATIQSCAHDYFNLPYPNIGCDNAFIEGPVKKLGLVSADFAFPTGINGKLRPARLINATGDFTVEFVRGDPYLDISATMGAGIHHISRLEYWNITGSGTANVELTYFDPNSGGVTDMNALRVVRYNGTDWNDEGVNGSLGSPGANGSITSNSIASFGSFTLAGSSDYPNNPLPTTQLKWSATVETENVLLQWQIAEENLYRGYIVEKSFNGNDFSPTGSLVNKQAIANQTYKLYDAVPEAGWNYYRLKLVGFNNQVYYSGITRIKMPEPQKLIVYPNPAREKIFIKIPNASSISKIAVVHISGSVIEWLTPKTKTAVSIDIQNLKPGVYYLKIIKAGSFSFVPFVKY